MSKPKILVTGATGKTGVPTTLGLLAKGFPVRALVRKADFRAERLRDGGAEIVVGSLESYGDLERAMKGVARAYFCPPLEPGTLRRASLFAAAACEAKLEAVVQLSQWVADAVHPALHAREKWLTNRVLSWMPDVGVITVQPGWFADNYFAVIGQAAQFGLLGLPLGQGLNAPPSNEDIARVIVACLANPAPHVGKAYRPTGPRLLSPPEIAEAIGQRAGPARQVSGRAAADVPESGFLARHFRIRRFRSSTGSCRITSAMRSVSAPRPLSSRRSRARLPKILSASPSDMREPLRRRYAGSPARCGRYPACSRPCWRENPISAGSKRASARRSSTDMCWSGNCRDGWRRTAEAGGAPAPACPTSARWPCRRRRARPGQWSRPSRRTG